MIKRKGSMIFDILLGLAAFLFIVGLITPTIIDWRFRSAFHDFIERTDKFIQLAVVDPYKGYASSSNEYCAPDYINSFEDLTAYRIIKCTSTENNINYYYDDSDPNNETNPDKSYIRELSSWINKDTFRDEGCRIYYSQGEDTSKYNVYFDCSSLRVPEMVDSEILVYFRRKYPVDLIGYDMFATSIDENTTVDPNANDHDGKVLLKFQK